MQVNMKSSSVGFALGTYIRELVHASTCTHMYLPSMADQLNLCSNTINQINQTDITCAYVLIRYMYTSLQELANMTITRLLAVITSTTNI